MSSQSTCMPSGCADRITFLPFTISRGMSPVKMVPGSPFSPCKAENLLRSSLLLPPPLRGHVLELSLLLPWLLTFRPPLQHCYSSKAFWLKDCKSLLYDGMLSEAFFHMLSELTVQVHPRGSNRGQIQTLILRPQHPA